MSLFRYSDYTNESKKNNIVQPRRGSHGGIANKKGIKLPTQAKSPNHKCSQCTRKDAKKYQVSAKECRWLCVDCLRKNNDKNNIEKPNFISAKKLFRKDSKY